MAYAQAQSGRVAPAREVNTISPLLPISVLLVSAAQSFNLLHKQCLQSPKVDEWAQTCRTLGGRYLGHASLSRIDSTICLMVQFFSAGVDDSATKVLWIEFLGLFGTIILVGYISANRSSAGRIVKWGTTIAFVLMQLFGAAVVSPLYYAMIVYKGSSSARASFIPSGWARTLLPSLIVAFIIPSMVMVVPELFTEYHREMAIAIWQPFPIAFSLMSIILALCFTGSGSSKSTSDAMVSTALIISSMDFMVVLSTLCHLYAVYIIYTERLPLRSFVPDLELMSTSAVTQAFLSFDFLGCMISLWTLIFYDTSRFAGVGRTSVTSAAVIAVLGTVLLGPGGAAAWAWSNIEKARLGALVADRPRKTSESINSPSAN